MTVLDEFVKIPVVVDTLADSVPFGAAELALLPLLEDPRQALESIVAADALG